MELDLYVDGSYSKLQPDITCGGMILLQGEKAIACQRYITKNPEMLSGNNHGGEIMAAMLGLASAIQFLKTLQKVDADSEVSGTINVYYDYKGVRNFVQGPERWRPSKESSLKYKGTYDFLREKYPNVIVIFYKVAAHTGNRWNEEVDLVAKGKLTTEMEHIRLRDVYY